MTKEIAPVNRKMTSSKLLAALLLTSGLVLAGCASKPKELPPQPSGAPITTTTTPPPVSQPTGPVPGSRADFMASVLGDTILFDTDRYNIDSEDQGILQSQAQWLARYPGARITIEGHCDERGTRDYNLALGERALYAGPIDCFRQIVRKEGVAGLYRGLRPNLIGVMPEKSLKLTVNDVCREAFTESNGPGGGIRLHQEMISGATAGFVQVAATNPMEIV